MPIATDIAFAVGAVALLGDRVPPSLKLFLLTLAIVDDVVAIVVIAVFYARGVHLGYLAAAVALLGAIVVLRRLGVVWITPYILLGLGVWLATHSSGVHPTIAGVALGLLTPAQPPTSAAVAGRRAGDLSDEPDPEELHDMTRLARMSVSLAERLERRLHPWTSLMIVPLFALANAGVVMSADALSSPGALRLAVGVAVALVVGKLLGISAAAWLAARTGVGWLPDGATFPMVASVGVVGGIGFTVSLFIAELAFPDGALLDAAKIGVLGGSAVAAVAGVAAVAATTRHRRA